MGDVAKPLKVMLPDYKAIEDRVENAVFARFGVPSPLPPCVKEIDVVMLSTEQVQLMRNRDDWDYTRGRKPADIVIPQWTHEEAEAEFLTRFFRLRSPADPLPPKDAVAE